ncbi:MAG: homoserine kinase [Robiginitomaculum sp.]|nr:MAG: homoserine kinase [Robiginitomaculum sp.]
MSIQQTIAEAPASVANLAVGFDILGAAFAGCKDRVIATRTTTKEVTLGQVSGLMDRLPNGVQENTALRGAAALLQNQGNPFGVQIDIEKNIPKSAGLGGSAASSVAAVLAVNALLDQPLGTQDLFAFALEGERASSDPPPADNVAACLYGGLIMLVPGGQGQIIQLPAPTGVECLVFHPDLEIETGTSRNALRPDVPLPQTIDFAAHLSAFTAACFQKNIPLFRQIMRDILIEPQRASGIPPLAIVQNAARSAGAISCGISGSGPSIFAWVETKQRKAVETAMAQAFVQSGIKAKAYASGLATPPASVISS